MNADYEGVLDDMEQKQHDESSHSSNINNSSQSDEELLKTTFSQLGVGHDGYLSLEELEKVCHAIGMENVASEVREELFNRLDVDCNSRISFDAFFAAFQSDKPTDRSQINIVSDVMCEDDSHLTNSNHSSSVSTNFGTLGSEWINFPTLDPEGTGYIGVSRLVDALFSLGLRVGSKLLRELGLCSSNGQSVSLRDLGLLLEEEVRSQLDSCQPQRQIALFTLLYECAGLRSSLEVARGERDKFRSDFGEVNHRFTLLAQELDEHNAKLECNYEKQLSELENVYKEQLHDLQEALKKERHNGHEDALSKSNELLSINTRLKEQDSKLRDRVIYLEKELKKQESENLDLSLKYSEAMDTMQSLEKQTCELNLLKDKVAELESLSPREEEFQAFASKVQALKQENQELRDANDELMAQVDNFPTRLLVSRQQEMSLDGSCIGDYLDHSSCESSAAGVKRRSSLSPIRKFSTDDEIMDPEGDNPKAIKIRKKNLAPDKLNYLNVSPHDESFIDDLMIECEGSNRASVVISSSGQSKTSLLGQEPKLESSFNEFRKQIECVKCVDLEGRLNMALDELEMALKRERQNDSQSSIFEIVENRETVLNIKCCKLESELAKLYEHVMKLEVENKRLKANTEDRKESNFSDLDKSRPLVYEVFRNLMAKIRGKYSSDASPKKDDSAGHVEWNMRTIPEEEETSEADDDVNGAEQIDLLFKRESRDVEKEINLLHETWTKQVEQLENQKAQLEQKYFKMEQEFQFLKLEHEKSDNYWNLKFQEEQDYYEGERQLYDEKFSTLEAKIKEYESMILQPPSTDSCEISEYRPMDALSDDSEERLSTIEESAVWERQVTELEDEIRSLQEKFNHATQEKESAEATWKEELQSLQKSHLEEVNPLRKQLDETRDNVKSLTEELETVRQELIHFKNNFGHEDDLASLFNKDQRDDTSDRKPSISERSVELNQNVERGSFVAQMISTHDLSKRRKNLELETVSDLLVSTDRHFQTTLNKYKEEMKKVASADSLICDLYCENSELMLALQHTEERQKRAEQQLRILEMAHVAQTNN